jgi:hypothetical protein
VPDLQPTKEEGPAMASEAPDFKTHMTWWGAMVAIPHGWVMRRTKSFDTKVADLLE